MTPLSVLLAEDEEDIRMLLGGWLEQAGHRVTGSASGQEAAARAQQAAFDLVVTDILMPDGDGVGLIADVKRLQPAARVLAISGGGRIIDSNDCLRIAKGLGAHAVVMKPFNREQFLVAVAEAMAPQPAPGFAVR